MKDLLQEYFGIRATKVKKIAGYANANYLVETPDKKYILKEYANIREEKDLVEEENRVLLHLKGKESESYPTPIPSLIGEHLTIPDIKSQNQLVRVLSFLEGDFLAEVPHSKQLFQSFGKFLADLDIQLNGIRSYVFEARKFEWDLQHFQEIIAPKVKFISDPGDRKLVEYFLMQHRELVQPNLYKLRKQVIHNDANDWNVLVQKDKVSGIIDFGDVCHTQLSNELAIAIAYAVLDKDDPLEWAGILVKSYHEILPLYIEEIDLLYYLIAARLCTSVCNSAEQKQKQPDNTYISVSEKPAWDLLKKWIRINPALARNHFRRACDIEIPHIEDIDKVRTSRYSNISPVFSISYKQPIYMQGAAFQYMFDKYGNTYLDAYNNIPHVGHNHPKVVEAGQKQMARLNTNTRYIYDSLNSYTEKLLSKFPSSLSKVYLVNSGSAASDLAVRLARNFSGKKRIAALEYGYHGNTESVIEISHYKFAGKGGSGPSDQVLTLPLPDTYRGNYRGIEAWATYIDEAKGLIDSNPDLAAFIAEPIVGCGGQIPLPSGYLKQIYAAVRKNGAVCISDEVQTGFGRLGDVFWGYEQHGVVPDIVVLGKPIGNGHPMGAVITTNEIAEAFDNGMEFFSSFGGNPVSCAIGQAVLEVIDEEGLQENARIVGDYYKSQLRQLQSPYPFIGDVRGSGLFLGFELIRENMKPDTILAQQIKNDMRKEHILLSTDGPHENVIKSKPPLCFTKDNVDEVVSGLSRFLNLPAS